MPPDFWPFPRQPLPMTTPIENALPV